MNIDVKQDIGNVTREVSTRAYEGKPARVVVVSRRYDTSPADLWEAITSADRIPRWFTPITGDLKLGGRYQLQGNAGGQILICEPPRHLKVTWEYGGRDELGGGADREGRNRIDTDPRARRARR